MIMKRVLLTVLGISWVLLPASLLADDRRNVLFLAIDDLRPELGCYGSPIARSPNIDALAEQGMVFDRAYCQEAICSPSRASLMTGARPDTIGIIENYTFFRDANPDIVTLSQHFIANGYEAVQVGKIYHNKPFSDDEYSWSRQPAGIDLPKPFHPYALPENRETLRRNKVELEAKYGVERVKGKGIIQGPAYEAADVPDQAYRDGYNTDVAIATLQELVAEDKPFFLGLGFYKPHLDFIAPQKYWDYYNEADIPLATFIDPPKNGVEMGLHASFEMRVRHGIPKTGGFDEELSRKLMHAYLACVSYIDAQIGRVLAALEVAGVRDNTIIMLWGDHGWHLGEMGIWGKATNYEISARVPLVVWTPDMAESSRGFHTKALVELVDLYPTLCDLAGLEEPEHLEGTSFAPMLNNPDQPWKRAAFSQFPNPAQREWAANPLSPSMHETFFGPLMAEVEARIQKQQGDRWDRDLFENHLMGYAMRTDRYRLVVWQDMRSPEADPIDVELYDHLQDPKETLNIAADEPALVEKLLAQFRAGWQGNLPPEI